MFNDYTLCGEYTFFLLKEGGLASLFYLRRHTLKDINGKGIGRSIIPEKIAAQCL